MVACLCPSLLIYIFLEVCEYLVEAEMGRAVPLFDACFLYKLGLAIIFLILG